MTGYRVSEGLKCALLGSRSKGRGMEEPPQQDAADGDASESAKEPQPQQEEEQEVVAVGAVAHVIRRAFHEFYKDAPSQQSTPRTVDDAATTDTSADAVPVVNSAEPAAAEGRDVLEDQCSAAIEPTYVSPPIATGLARKQQLQQELHSNHANANALLNFLAKRHTEAQQTDEAIDAELRRKGLVIKAQIPMGPSNLRLEQHELVEAFGDATAALLVHAKQLVSEFHQRRLDTSGNGANSQWRRAALKAEEIGYLDTTSSYDTRKEATLAAHQTHIENVREHTMMTKMRHAASNKLTSGNVPTLSDPIEGQHPEVSSLSSPSPSPSAKKPNPQVMNAVEKRKNTDILRRMNTKLDFLRNPRYVKDSVRFSDHGDGEDETNEDEHERQERSKRLIQAAGFVSVPSPVEFIEYDTDGIYEQVVCIRNTSALSRRMRVLPPSTLPFSIHEVVFPDSSGLIAPGMHVEIRLRFAPDSRADYRDSIAIQYEGDGAQSMQLLVPLYAHRRPPELSIPLVLYAQTTLVGGESLTKITCKNTGGPGRFWLLSEQEWSRIELSSGGVLRATSNLDLMHGNQAAQLSVGPFCMTPNELDLNTGDSVELKLHYVPSCIGEQREKMVMVCDNCLVRVFQLVGRGCQIEINISAINGKLIDTGITQMGAVNEVYFDPLFIDSSSTKSLVVSNGTPINLNFSWRIEPMNGPQVQLPAAGNGAEDNSPYQITPASGTFQLSSSREFHVTFAPRSPSIYIWRAILCINDVPACCMPGPEQVNQLMNMFQVIKDGTTSFRETLVEQVPCKSLKLIGAGRLGQFTISPFIRLSSSLSRDGPLLKHVRYTANVMVINDTDAALNIKWDLDRIEQRHMSKNSGQTKINSAGLFDLCIEPKQTQLAPNTQINATVTFTPHCVGNFMIAIPCRIPMNEELNQPTDSFERWLLLEGVVATGDIQIVDPEVDFGLVLVGTSAEQKLILRNNSTAETQWRLVHLEAADDSYGSTIPKELDITHQQPTSIARRYTDPSQRKMSRDVLAPSSRHSSILSVTSNGMDSARSSSMSTFRDTAPRASIAFAPENGQLAAGETQTITVRCLAGVLPERFRAHFCCHQAPERLFSGEHQAKSVMVSARAEIQCPNVYLMPMKLHLGTTYKDVTVSRKLELVNLSNLETSFKFAEPQGTSKMYSVEFLPKQGVLRSKETLSIVMQYTPRQAGKNTVLFACMVRGLPSPLGFEVITNQKGLVLSYELLPTSADGKPIAVPKSPKEIALERGMTISDCDLEPETNPLSNFPKLQFGDAISLATRSTILVLIRNFSGIEAIIELEAKRFPAMASLTGLMSSNQTLYGSDTASSLNSSSQLSISPTSNRQRALGYTKRPQKQSTTSTSSKKKKLLSNSHEHARRFQSEKGKEYVDKCDEDEEARHVLSQGHGVVFQARPNHFRIPPWEQVVAAITCFNNMPGTYNDDIVSRAMGMPPVFLHASANVVGTPLAVDRNCVGLYFGKHGNKKPQLISIAGRQLQKPVQPTLHFGQLCTRSSKVTRTIRIINRGPKAARLKWNLVEKNRENQLVNVTLRINSNAGIQFQILPCEENDTAFPFEIDPPTAVIAPFATVPFQITYNPSQQLASPRILLLADAKWYNVNGLNADSLSESNSQTSVDSSATDPHVQDLRCEESPPASKSRSPQVANTPVGKAFTAVRMVNLIARRQPPISFDTPPTSVTPKCLRVLLAADVIEPELFLDQSPVGILPVAERGRYHVHFKTWSTIAEKPSELMHSFHRKQLFLVNHMNTRLTFRFDCTGPFSVFQADSLAPKHPLSLADLPPAHRRAQGESYMFTLPPQMSVRLDVRFDPSGVSSTSKDQVSSSSNFVRRQSLPAGGSSASTLATTSSSSLSTTQNSRNALKRPAFSGELLVRFANHAVQTIRLAAEIIRPILLVSPSMYFFGHMHLSKTRSVVLRLANASEVPASFKIQHVPRPTPVSRAQKQEVKRHHSHFVDEPGVFTFASLQGIVEGPTLSLRSSGGYSPTTNSTQDLGSHPIVKNAVEIVVTFRAPAIKKHYKSRFRFVVEHGADFEIVLEGEGHLNEQEVLDQDRSLVRTQTITHSNRMFKRGLR